MKITLQKTKQMIVGLMMLGVLASAKAENENIIFESQNPTNTEVKTSSNDSVASAYRLGPGDKIQVLVFGEAGMGVEAKLTDAGTFIHPLLGEITASGLTIGELSAKVVNQLKGKYLKEPKVSINITEYREFYINGEVQKPGAYHFTPGLTVFKAISMAGGFTQRASRTNIELIADKSQSKVAQTVGLDAPINPGDVLTIEESFF